MASTAEFSNDDLFQWGYYSLRLQEVKAQQEHEGVQTGAGQAAWLSRIVPAFFFWGGMSDFEMFHFKGRGDPEVLGSGNS